MPLEVEMNMEPDSKGELVPVLGGMKIVPDPEPRHFLAVSEKARRVRSSKGFAGLFTGSEPIYPTAQSFLHAAIEYFCWVEQNPDLEVVKKYDSAESAWVETTIPRKKIKTISGLCGYLAISNATLLNYRNERYPEVCQFIDDAIRTEREVGGANGMLNAGFIARLIGLSDRKEFTGKDGQPLHPPGEPVIDYSRLSDSALDEIMALKEEAAKRDSGEK